MNQPFDANKYDYLHAEDPEIWQYSEKCVCKLCCQERWDETKRQARKFNAWSMAHLDRFVEKETGNAEHTN